jgi:putative redox protein
MPRTIAAELSQTGPSTSTGQVRSHSVLVDRPTAKGGADAGPMGGELVLVGLGGCFLSNLLAAIRARGAAISDVRVRVEGELADAPERFTGFALHVTAKHEGREEFEKLVTIAERGCLVSNTLRNCAPIQVIVDSAAE